MFRKTFVTALTATLIAAAGTTALTGSASAGGYGYGYGNGGGYGGYHQPNVRVRKQIVRRHKAHHGKTPHEKWCYGNYRSYRAFDNTFQPYDGPRKFCVSPFTAERSEPPVDLTAKAVVPADGLRDEFGNLPETLPQGETAPQLTVAPPASASPEANLTPGIDETLRDEFGNLPEVLPAAQPNARNGGATTPEANAAPDTAPGAEIQANGEALSNAPAKAEVEARGVDPARAVGGENTDPAELAAQADTAERDAPQSAN
ncbi:BA14K family protein [Roseibium sp. M-1]